MANLEVMVKIELAEDVKELIKTLASLKTAQIVTPVVTVEEPKKRSHHAPKETKEEKTQPAVTESEETPDIMTPEEAETVKKLAIDFKNAGHKEDIRAFLAANKQERISKMTHTAAVKFIAFVKEKLAEDDTDAEI